MEKLKYRRIGITTRSDFAEGVSCTEEIIKILTALQATVFLDTERCSVEKLRHIPALTKKTPIDLLITVGGDGTLLRAIRELHNPSTPILSVHRGTVGFLTELAIDDLHVCLPKLLQGKGSVIDERSMFTVLARRGKQVLWEGTVLNEAVVSQGAISRLIDLETRINGKRLAVFHADGIIVATPTGSTAYSLAAGGPIVHPQLRATILTPINPHSFNQKPVVIPEEHVIEITILTTQSRFSDAQVSLTLDGQTYVSLQGGDTVRVVISKRKARLLRRKEDTFFATLRKKLHWGERMEK